MQFFTYRRIASSQVDDARSETLCLDDDQQGVRLIGVGVSGLVPAGSAQEPLFLDAATVRSRKLGEQVVTRASLLRSKK